MFDEWTFGQRGVLYVQVYESKSWLSGGGNGDNTRMDLSNLSRHHLCYVQRLWVHRRCT